MHTNVPKEPVLTRPAALGARSACVALHWVVAQPAPSRRRSPAARRAFLGLDLVFAIGATILLTVLFSVAIAQFSRAREDTDARRALRLVVEAELRRVRAGVVDAPALRRADDPARDMQLATTTTRGEGAWLGFDHVRVVGRKAVGGGRWVEVALATYVPRLEGAP